MVGVEKMGAYQWSDRLNPNCDAEQRKLLPFCAKKRKAAPKHSVNKVTSLSYILCPNDFTRDRKNPANYGEKENKERYTY